MDNMQFTDLVLLIGTNPLPNFVVAEYFLQQEESKIERIWLVYSEANVLQKGTRSQADRLETLLRNHWRGKHETLKFPLIKVPLSDVSHAGRIYQDIQQNMLKRPEWEGKVSGFHLNYTGGTKAVSVHAYWLLKEHRSIPQKSFSYLDARNFRLIDDLNVVREEDLRDIVQIEFAELIELHGFEKMDVTAPVDFATASQEFQKFINSDERHSVKEGYWLEAYITTILGRHLEKRRQEHVSILQNWRIRHPDWHTAKNHNFELDVIVLYGYQLTMLSSTITAKMLRCKNKGFEVIRRARQIGGDEAKSILLTGTGKYATDRLQEVLQYDTGGTQSILVLGIEDLCNGTFVDHIDHFIFGEGQTL